MAPSREVDDATGEAPTAAELLDAKTIELAQASAALVTAETKMDVAEVVRLQNIVSVLRRMIGGLQAKAAVEAAATAREEAVALDAHLRKRYADKLGKLMPDIDDAREAIQKMSASVRKCARTWQAAQRAQFETKLLAMRFGLDTPEMDVLPMSPLDAMTTAFWEEMDKHDSLCRKDALPVVTELASDSPDQLTAKRMVAAAAHVESYGKDMKLSADLLALFAKAGSVAAVVPPRAQEPLWDLSLPAGAYQDALGPTTGPTVPETLAERTHREEEQRALARSRADLAREMGEDAQRLKAGPPKGSGPMQGLRA